MSKKALYLAGGGARGAYQAGVLKAISHILQEKTLPFEIISGVSVGSVNAVILAENAHDFPTGIEKLEDIWRGISCQKVYNASNYQLSKSVLRNLSRLLIKQQQCGYLLDTSPLCHLLSQHIDFNLIEKNILENHLEALEVISHCYETQQTISFYQHNISSFEDWQSPRHISQRAIIHREHVLASSALPLFFPTVKIDALHYGDGSMGLVAPLRGAIRFQVDKILILGTRQLAMLNEVHPEPQNGKIGFASILGGMLNGLFLDNLDRDIEMVNRMNEIAQLVSLWKKRRSPWRPIETLHLRPSIDIAAIAQAQYMNMPMLLRFLLNIMGAKNQSGDLLSFLLFEKEFTGELIDLGYQDTLCNASAVNAFFQ